MDKNNIIDINSKRIESSQPIYRKKEGKKMNKIGFLRKVLKSKSEMNKGLIEKRFKGWRKYAFKDMRFNKVAKIKFKYERLRPYSNKKRSLTVTKTISINRILDNISKDIKPIQQKKDTKKTDHKKVYYPIDKNRAVRNATKLRSESNNNNNRIYNRTIIKTEINPPRAYNKINNPIIDYRKYIRDKSNTPRDIKRTVRKIPFKNHTPNHNVYRRREAYSNKTFENKQNLNIVYNTYSHNACNYRQKKAFDDSKLTKEMLKKGVSIAIQHYRGRIEIHKNFNNNKIY